MNAHDAFGALRLAVGPRASEPLAMSQRYEAQCATPEAPLVWDRAERSRVWDVNGREYIDFTSGARDGVEVARERTRKLIDNTRMEPLPGKLLNESHRIARS
jgi:hypothetical protein